MFKQPKAPVTIPKDQITKINYSGLKGRIIHIPSKTKTKTKLVFVAGQHSSHERMYHFGEFLADFTNVYMIDVPGFGGMPSLASIGKKITYDNYADYLYTVLKTQGLTKNLIFFGGSFGGQLITRMLQKYPESQKWTTIYIGFVSFIGRQDFHMNRIYRTALEVFARLSISRIGLWFTRLWRNRFVMPMILRIFALFKTKMRGGDTEKRRKHIRMERHLWVVNDAKTHGMSAIMAWNQDLRTFSDELIDVPVHNIITKDDQYFDYKEVNKSFRDVYTNYAPHYLSWQVHMPSMIESKKEVEQLIDPKIITDILKSEGWPG